MNPFFSCICYYASVLLNFLIPPFCSACKLLLENRAPLCDICAKNVTPIVSYSLAINKQYTVTTHALSDYKMPLKKLVVAKRYGNSVASRQLGHLMALCMPVKLKKYDLIVPIPLHWIRSMQRGYNQSEEIAYELSKQHGIPIAHIVKRNRNTAYQTGMNRSSRITNVKNAFELAVHDKEVFKGKRLLLVDDVMTTGETIRSVARELSKLSPEVIDAFVACRVV